MEQYGQLIYLGLLLVALGGWVVVEYRSRLGLALRTALAWGMIFLGVMAGYGLWQDLRGDLAPRQTASATQIAIPRAQDGHYYPQLMINGQELTFMADTGASGIVLSKADAASLGLDLANLAFLGTANTANGPVRTARVRLDQINFGPFADQNVPAYVNEGEMEGSLLGMEYLGRFNITISDQEMVLTR